MTEEENEQVVAAQANKDAVIALFQEENHMMAEMMIEPPEGNGAPVTPEDLKAALDKAGIVFGIEQDALDKLAAPLYGKKLVVARGMPAKDGEDGVCTELFSRTVEKKMHTRDDGSVDYRELGLIREVREGAVICEITPPGPGQDGKTLQGKAIKAREGKKAIPPVGENVRPAEGGTRFEAAVTGNLVFRDGRFVVDTVVRVQDVDYDVGNITFSGDVQVNGDMQSGFEIHSGGTVTLRGQIGSVVIKAHHLVIEKGVNGMGRAVLDVEGTVKAGFVENCNLHVGEKLTAQSLINCQVECEGDVDVMSGKGIICGGKITAFGSVQAKVVGNESNTLTTIVLGVTPKLLKERRRLNDQLADVSRHLEELNKNVSYIERLVAEGRPVPPERVQFLQRAQIQLPFTEKKRIQLERQIAELEEKMHSVNHATLTANIIFPPTRVSIGALSQNVVDKRSKCRVYKNHEGDMVFGSA